MPNEASDTQDADAQYLAQIFLDSGAEWIKYVEWRDGRRVKIEHHGRNIARALYADSLELIGDFEVTAAGRRLPPLGPEDDGALRDELAAVEQARHDELIWVPRTWADVRPGDDVRLPGTDNVAHVQHAVHLRWHVDPRTGTSSWNPPQPLEWSGVHVMLRTAAHPDQPADLTMDPAKAVEIHLTQSEADAMDALDAAGLAGWRNRAGLIES